MKPVRIQIIRLLALAATLLGSHQLLANDKGCLARLDKGARISWFDGAKSTFAEPVQGSVKVRKVNARWRQPAGAAHNWLSGQLSWGLDYRYWTYALAVRDEETAQTNGHLHQLAVPILWQIRSNDEKNNVMLLVSPTLAVSSNLLKQPAQLAAEHLQLNYALIWRRVLDPERKLYLGICAHQQKGKSAPQLLLALDLSSPVWGEFLLGYPQIHWRQSLTKDLELAIKAVEQGYLWRVANKDLTRHSSFRHYGQQLSLTLRWQYTEQLRLELGVYRARNNRMRYLSASNQVLEAGMEDYSELLLAFSWRSP